MASRSFHVVTTCIVIELLLLLHLFVVEARFSRNGHLSGVADLTSSVKPSHKIAQQDQLEQPSSSEKRMNRFIEDTERVMDTSDQNIPLQYFTTELTSRPNQVVATLYMSEEKGLENANCENSLYPCRSIGHALKRLDTLVSNWILSMNQSQFLEQQYNIHVKLEFSGDLNGDCNNVLVTPMYSNINYLFEIYSNSVHNVLTCNETETSLFEVRSDMTRFYFHDLKLSAFLSSFNNFNVGFYNCVLSFSRITIGGFESKNFTIGDAIFQRVYSEKQTHHIQMANIKTVQFIGVSFIGSSSFSITVTNCENVEFSNSYFDFLSIRSFYSSKFIMDNCINVGCAIIITHGNSVNIENSKFFISKYYLPTVACDFVESVKISNCQAERLDVFLSVGAISKLLIEFTTVLNCNVLGSYKNMKSIIEISSVDTVKINECTFLSNIGVNGGALSLQNVITLIVTNSKFEDNRASVSGGAIGVLSFSENGYHSNSFVDNTTFSGNRAERFGGAVYLGTSLNMAFTNCLFKENYATESGGGLFIHQDQIGTRIFNSKFIGNLVSTEKSGSRIGFMESGCGGALSILFVSYLTGAYSGAYFIRNSALRGGAICLGLLKNWNHQPYLIDNMTFIENSAMNSGGAIFLCDQFSLVESQGDLLLSPNIQFKYNRASIYGNNLALAGNNLTIYNTNSWIESGKNITIEMDLMNSLNMDVPLLSEYFRFTSIDLYTIGYVNEKRRINLVSYFTSPIYESKNTTITITTESLITKQFNITLIPCEKPLQMVAEIIDEKQVFLCKKKIDLITLILSITIPVSVLMLVGGAVLGFFLFYGCSKIVSKLRLLKKKEKAEKNLERKILDNKIVFEMSDSESNYTISRGYSSSKSKNKLRYSEFDSPLLDNNHNYNQRTISVANSVVIPVEDIQITKRIGEGGYGNVYKGLWVNTEVAIKSLKTTEDNHEFEKEAAILSHLRHPNIVSFYGVCITDSAKYMVTEYVQKGSLDKIIYKCKNNLEFLSLKDRIGILIGVSNGMNYLHSLQPSVIHRDLKPPNILLDDLNNSKVCDFGLVKIIGHNQAQSTMSVNVGTLFYISNESLQPNTQKITHKTDVYSFGIVMYELFFLENPYLNSSSSKIHYFRKAVQDDQPFTVPMRVLNNERPIIPFNDGLEFDEWMNVYGQETSAPLSLLKQVSQQYISLMTVCWDMNPDKRPEFSEISKQLIQLRDKLN